MVIHRGQPDLRRDLFGGNGLVKVWNLLANHRRQPAPFTAVLSCELEAGGRVGPHKQERFPEIVIGLGGSATLKIAGNSQVLGPGDVAYLPLGKAMAIENTSAEEPFRYLIIKAEQTKAGSRARE